MPPELRKSFLGHKGVVPPAPASAASQLSAACTGSVQQFAAGGRRARSANPNFAHERLLYTPRGLQTVRQVSADVVTCMRDEALARSGFRHGVAALQHTCRRMYAGMALVHDWLLHVWHLNQRLHFLAERRVWQPDEWHEFAMPMVAALRATPVLWRELWLQLARTLAGAACQQTRHTLHLWPSWGSNAATQVEIPQAATREEAIWIARAPSCAALNQHSMPARLLHGVTGPMWPHPELQHCLSMLATLWPCSVAPPMHLRANSAHCTGTAREAPSVIRQAWAAIRWWAQARAVSRHAAQCYPCATFAHAAELTRLALDSHEDWVGAPMYSRADLSDLVRTALRPLVLVIAGVHLNAFAPQWQPRSERTAWRRQSARLVRAWAKDWCAATATCRSAACQWDHDAWKRWHGSFARGVMDNLHLAYRTSRVWEVAAWQADIRHQWVQIERSCIGVCLALLGAAPWWTPAQVTLPGLPVLSLTVLPHATARHVVQMAALIWQPFLTTAETAALLRARLAGPNGHVAPAQNLGRGASIFYLLVPAAISWTPRRECVRASEHEGGGRRGLELPLGGHEGYRGGGARGHSKGPRQEPRAKATDAGQKNKHVPAERVLSLGRQALPSLKWTGALLSSWCSSARVALSAALAQCVTSRSGSRSTVGTRRWNCGR